MNKGQLVERLAGDLGSKAAAERAIDAVLDAVRKGLKKDGKVQVVGFGTFEVRKRKARMGRNPQTGESIKIKASKTVAFRPGKDLKSKI